ncbi:MAG: DegV family protein, partial [Chloroflexi bacterium]|nr:DegV family protein [Chloroflexota bacterium]
MSIQVVTDSTASLPPELAAELGITVIPTHVSFGTTSYRDGVD